MDKLIQPPLSIHHYHEAVLLLEGEQIQCYLEPLVLVHLGDSYYTSLSFHNLDEVDFSPSPVIWLMGHILVIIELLMSL